MMKKTYINPQLEVVVIAAQQMLCGSFDLDGDNLNVTFDDETFGDDETINVHEFGDEGFDWEE